MADANRSPSRERWSLKSLRYFEVCARHRTFSSAAEELLITQSAVSKQIKSLEENLGFVLFERDQKSNKLTVEGRALANYLGSMFEDLQEVIYSINKEKYDEPLIVSSEPTICLKLIIPLVPQIERETGISVRILSGGGPIDFRNQSVDLAIRRNDFPIPENIFKKTLCKEYMGPITTREFFESSNRNSDRRPFVKIHSMTRPHAWSDWQERTGIGGFDGDISYQHHFLALEAAESGQGMAMMSIHMVARLLENDNVVAPFGFSFDHSRYVCLSDRPFETDPRRRAVFEWLEERFNANERLACAISDEATGTGSVKSVG